MPATEVKHAIATLGRDVHVWLANLDPSSDLVDQYRRHLTESELQVVARYKTPELRNRQTVSKGSLRGLLAGYLNEGPEHIALRCNEFGKPSLAGAFENGDLHFNASHSSCIGLFAFTKNRAIGVDVEEILRGPDWQEAAQICLTGFEMEWLLSVPSEQRPQTFFEIWTIKEAYLKAVGTGLSIEPTSIELQRIANHEYQFRKVPIESCEGWTIFSFTPLPGFAAAVVVEGHRCEIHRFDWDTQSMQLGAA